MNNTDIPPVTTRSARVDVRPDPDGVTVKFSGVMDELHPGEFLDPLFEKVHERAVEAGCSQGVVADFTELQFLNSSGIKSVAKWIVKQMGLEDDARYSITLLYSSQMTWQRASIKALGAMSRGTVVARSVD